jgi:hypothetical protein
LVLLLTIMLLLPIADDDVAGRSTIVLITAAGCVTKVPQGTLTL